MPMMRYGVNIAARLEGIAEPGGICLSEDAYRQVMSGLDVPRAGKRRVDGKSLRLADEVRYIQQCAADHDGRVVTVGQLVLFSTETGDAWLLDPADQLAARLARDGDPEPIHIEENDTF